MEAKNGRSAEGGSEEVRGNGVQHPGDSGAGEEGLPGGDAVAMRRALEALTPRERAIFNAGMAAGAAQQLAQTASQHVLFINASREQAQKRSAQALTLLEKAPPSTEPSSATQAGAEAARRLVAAGKAILGR